VDLARHPKLHIAGALGVNVEKWLYELPAPKSSAIEKVVAAVGGGKK
jgi:hypothetical protein